MNPVLNGSLLPPEIADFPVKLLLLGDNIQFVVHEMITLFFLLRLLPDQLFLHNGEFRQFRVGTGNFRVSAGNFRLQGSCLPGKARLGLTVVFTIQGN